MRDSHHKPCEKETSKEIVINPQPRLRKVPGTHMRHSILTRDEGQRRLLTGGVVAIPYEQVLSRRARSALPPRARGDKHLRLQVRRARKMGCESLLGKTASMSR